MNKEEILFYFGSRPIAFHPAIAHAVGGAVPGLFLSQLIYWSDRGRDSEGWIYKTGAEWTAETCLSRSEQERARTQLKNLQILEEVRRGVPAKMLYRIDFAVLAGILQFAGSNKQECRIEQTRMQDSTNKIAGSSILSIAENTTETTSEKARSASPTGESEHKKFILLAEEIHQKIYGQKLLVQAKDGVAAAKILKTFGFELAVKKLQALATIVEAAHRQKPSSYNDCGVSPSMLLARWNSIGVPGETKVRDFKRRTDKISESGF